MNKSKLLRGLCVFWAVAAVSACQGTDDAVEDVGEKNGADIQRQIDRLGDVRVVDVDLTGVPNFVNGTLGQVKDTGDPEALLTDALVNIAPIFRANIDDLELKRADDDPIGDWHFRFSQVKNGLPVLGGELILHVRDGVVYAANGSVRDDLPAPDAPEIGADEAIAAALSDASSVLGAGAAEDAPLAYRLADARLALVYQVNVTGERADGTPVNDTVLVNALDGSIVDRIAHIHTAKNREVHNLNHGTSLPGPTARVEGGAASSDASVNGNYDRLGTVWDCYKNLFNRDSFNNAGAKLISSVHYSNNYVNAYWNGTQMVYGDGNGVDASDLSLSMDVTAHELTHAVTEYTSNLTYSGESGGLNESMSDIFGNVCEYYRDGQVVSSNTWKVGEDIWTPGTSGDALRYMNDPALDGASKDYWTSSVGSVDVHYSSGVSNLAFYLLSQGGTHPRGKSSINVPGIGIAKAAQIFYRANASIMTSSTNFAGAKTATEQAASQLGYSSADIAAVTAAWQAVGVGVVAPPPTTTALTNGVPVTGISDSSGGEKFYTLVVPSGATSLSFVISGGSGDADLYVKFGSSPTTSSYDCRPYLNGNAETCTISNIQAGTYYVMLRAYSSYSGVSLTGTYGTGGGGGNVLTNGVPVTGLSGATNSTQNWTMSVPSGKSSLSFTISGGSGDADMYVKYGSAPTTSSYNCRPYLYGNNETCTFSNPSSGTWYVMLRGYTSYSGVSLVGQY